MTVYALERKARLHWHEPTREDDLVAHMFDDKFPAWSICHRIQRWRGFAKAAKRPAIVCQACAKQYDALLSWIPNATRK